MSHTYKYANRHIHQFIHTNIHPNSYWRIIVPLHVTYWVARHEMEFKYVHEMCETAMINNNASPTAPHVGGPSAHVPNTQPLATAMRPPWQSYRNNDTSLMWPQQRDTSQQWTLPDRHADIMRPPWVHPGLPRPCLIPDGFLNAEDVLLADSLLP